MRIARCPPAKHLASRGPIGHEAYLPDLAVIRQLTDLRVHLRIQPCHVMAASLHAPACSVARISQPPEPAAHVNLGKSQPRFSTSSTGELFLVRKGHFYFLRMGTFLFRVDTGSHCLTPARCGIYVNVDSALPPIPLAPHEARYGCHRAVPRGAEGACGPHARVRSFPSRRSVETALRTSGATRVHESRPAAPSSSTRRNACPESAIITGKNRRCRIRVSHCALTGALP